MKIEGKLEVETPWSDNPMPYIVVGGNALSIELDEFKGKDVIITVSTKR